MINSISISVRDFNLINQKGNCGHVLYIHLLCLAHVSELLWPSAHPSHLSICMKTLGKGSSQLGSLSSVAPGNLRMQLLQPKGSHLSPSQERNICILAVKMHKGALRGLWVAFLFMFLWKPSIAGDDSLAILDLSLAPWVKKWFKPGDRADCRVASDFVPLPPSSLSLLPTLPARLLIELKQSLGFFSGEH